jgi:A/G-specific adenine glycosylase
VTSTPSRLPANDHPADDLLANDLLADDLLAWYDRYRRELPWRAAHGGRMDPYRVWLSEIMLQQTTVRTVGPYFEHFLARFPSVRALAFAPLEEVLAAWAGLGYYSRARNLHACAKAILEGHRGEFPRTEAELATLPGIGPYTAAAIACIAFEEKTVPVDGNVERVIARLFRVADALPRAKPRLRMLARRLAPPLRNGDFAQALMDLGAMICRLRQPACALCPWHEPCAARVAADQESYPRKSAKREGKLRHGAAFIVLREDGAVLVRRRKEHGLLGGMTEVPGSEWSIDFDLDAALAQAPHPVAGPAWDWQRAGGHVRHVFTHFPLQLLVFVASAGREAQAPSGCRFLPRDKIASAAFPTLMRKVLAHAGIGPDGAAIIAL